MVHAGIIAVYGYALIVAFLALFAIPWQVTNVLLALVVLTIFSLRRVRKATSKGFNAFRARVSRIWGSFLVIGVLLGIQIGVTGVEADLSIDGQLYHGPALANIVQSGSLWGWTASNQYVYYSDLSVAGGVNLATFAGDARFDNALQVPHLVLLVLLINWALSLKFTSSFARISFAALIVSAPVIWLQPRILYVDLAYGVAVLGCIFFATLVQEFRKLDILVAGVALAAVFATKPTGILTGIFLLVVLVCVLILRSRKMAQARKVIPVILLGLGAPLVMAMSFYFRNLVQFANPVYPVQVRLGPLVLPGILDLSVFASGERGNGLVDPSRIASYFHSVGFGMLHGVTKLDYDPRIGGFGMVPTFLLMLTLALVVVQLLSRNRARGVATKQLAMWKVQVGIVSMAVVILLVQPATFDARYTIGPTVALFVAVLLTSLAALTAVVQLSAGGVALLLAFGQITWTEYKMYPGVRVAQEILQGPEAWQPNAPGNPRGRGPQTAWLPSNSEKCFVIALQTNGGVTQSGMTERSYLGTFSYGLYGDGLCNQVLPITVANGDDSPEVDSEVRRADYLIVYQQDVGYWEKEFSELETCLRPVDSVEPSENYPQPAVVLRNTCS